MRSQRVYQEASPTDRILAVLQRNDGKQFDQNLVRRFVQLVGIYPVGNLVRLNTEDIAVVLKVYAPDPYRPRVRVLIDRTGKKIEHPIELNLWETREDEPQSIEAPLDPADYDFDPLTICKLVANPALSVARDRLACGCRHAARPADIAPGARVRTAPRGDRPRRARPGSAIGALARTRARGATPSAVEPFLRGSIIVKFRRGSSADARRRLLAQVSGDAAAPLSYAPFEIVSIGDPAADPEAVARRLEAQPDVEYAQARYRVYPRFTPNDPQVLAAVELPGYRHGARMGHQPGRNAIDHGGRPRQRRRVPVGSHAIRGARVQLRG